MASNNAPSPTVAAVEHTEGTSYVVAFGDPARYPIFGSDRFPMYVFPAAGGENPYQPESGLLADLNANLVTLGENEPPGSLIMQIGNALCVPIYDALRCVPEESRGLSYYEVLTTAAESNQEFKTIMDWMVAYHRRAGLIGVVAKIYCLATCFYRMCYRDGTLQICTKTPEEATTDGPTQFDLRTLYFNLSARERTRLREYANGVRRERRMPYVLARQLIIKKVDKKKLHGQHRRIVYGLFVPESDELFRVVVSFL